MRGRRRIPPPPGAVEAVRAAFAAQQQNGTPSGELAGTAGRSRKYDLRCSPEEVERWEAAAQAEGISTSAFIRAAADERAAQLVS